MKNKKTAESFRLPTELLVGLREAKKETGIPMNFLLVKAWNHYKKNILDKQHAKI